MAERDRVERSSTADNRVNLGDAASPIQTLIVTVGGRACAVPVQHVLETMRALPIEPIAGAPAFVRGLSVIRGAPIPVVDLGALLGSPMAQERGRFVTLKLGTRQVALAVDQVIGLRTLDRAGLSELPALVRDGGGDLIDGIGAADAQLLVVLRATRVVPEEVWATLVQAAG